MRRTRKPGETVYVASKKRHAPMWRRLRSEGRPIKATWIDEGETIAHWGKLWDACLKEASTARVVIVYGTRDDVHEGALLEVGAALAAGVPVVWVGPAVSSVVHHPLVRLVATLDEAFSVALADPPPEPRDGRTATLTLCGDRGVEDAVEFSPAESAARRRRARDYIASMSSSVRGRPRVTLTMTADDKATRTLPVDLHGLPHGCRTTRACVEGQDLLAWVAREWSTPSV